MGDTNPISTLGDYSKPSHEGYRNTIELPAGNNVLPLRCDTIRNCKTPQRYPDIPTTSSRISLRSMDSRTIDQSAGGKLRDRNAKESWALLKDLSLHENESWNDQRNFVKSVKVISLPQDVPITSDRRLIELENQVQRLMEAHLAPTQPTQVNKITTSCEICSGPHDTQYCMEDLEQAFVKYASSRTDEAGGEDLQQESTKKQKMDDNKKKKELKQCFKIVPNDGDDVTIDATPLFVKIPIADYKIYQEGKKSFFQIIRADVQTISYYLLVDKMYPLTKHTLHQMFNNVKLQVDYECKIAFDLLRLVKKQLKEGYGRIVGIKSLLEVTAVKVLVTAAKHKLVLLVILMKNMLSISAAGTKVTTVGAERLQLLKG
ncbi:hypothetical protein Tco_0092463 [Tanacetum coccineum]